MSEKPEALLRRQHADNISVAHMKIRIERLEAENERLREALEKIATVNAMDYEYVRWAKAALRREY